jgi:1-deoxy-D-xylulose-5-phosphate synthase
LGFVYLGPIDGHDLKTLRGYLERVKALDGPVLLHVLTNKGHGFEPAVRDPVRFHAPAPFEKSGDGIVPLTTTSSRTYTDCVSDTLFQSCRHDLTVAVITAAMCEGNKLQKIRDNFPNQFFDVGICESHAVAFAAGMAKAGARPVVDIYSTFLQRSYDQIFQEVALQNLAVVFSLDRAGLVGADGPTHHGSYDLAYLRVLPNIVIMAPGHEKDIEPMFQFALQHNSPVAIRYPRANLDVIERMVQPVELGQAEIVEWETDGMLLACGSMVNTCIKVAALLRNQYEMRVGVINARFIKPLDRQTICKAIEGCSFVITVEEASLIGGFGSAVLELANEMSLSTTHIRRLGLPDRYILHAEREEQLAEVGLDINGIVHSTLALATELGWTSSNLGTDGRATTALTPMAR